MAVGPALGTLLPEVRNGSGSSPFMSRVFYVRPTCISTSTSLYISNRALPSVVFHIKSSHGYHQDDQRVVDVACETDVLASRSRPSRVVCRRSLPTSPGSTRLPSAIVADRLHSHVPAHHERVAHILSATKRRSDRGLAAARVRLRHHVHSLPAAVDVVRPYHV
jgi:hypothetical protein